MSPLWWSRQIGDGDVGRDVAIVQRKLGLLPTGRADVSFSLVVRGYQKALGLPSTGYVDEETARRMGEQEGFGLLPTWWTHPVVKATDSAYAHALDILGCHDADGVRRFQGSHRLPPTGDIDETTARLLAGLEVETCYRPE